jgi:hypothetical protein
MAMSWREILGAEAPAHNPQNTQNPLSADCADSAYQESETRSRLLETLGRICQALSIPPAEVHQALTPEDIKAWQHGQIGNDTLTAFARLLMQRKAMDEGRQPVRYNQPATCHQCGPVWLWFSGEVLACPWCRNRLQGKPIPRPVPVRCGDCRHFRRIDHPHLGHCDKGQPEPVTGLWDKTGRGCGYYLPALHHCSNGRA